MTDNKEERHPLVQNMIDICEEARKEADPINKLMRDLGFEVNGQNGIPKVEPVQMTQDELINFLRACGVPESEIKLIMQDPPPEDLE